MGGGRPDADADAPLAALLAGLPPAKLRHCAAEARVLDAAELKDISVPKRHVLLLCLLTRTQVQARDDLVAMFRADEAAQEGGVVADDGVLHRVRQREEHDKIEHEAVRL